MIEFLSQTTFKAPQPKNLEAWILQIIEREGHTLGEVTYVFCDDPQLHKINLEYLHHDTFTDIISFDYTVGKQINSEIFISTDRVKENAITFGVPFEKELLRVLIHGIFHCIGYKDGTALEKEKMRQKEDEAITLFKS